ncbi:sugar kinase [Chakrabartyella piscis]|uniref:sugar kinase n=1 Tax=Chakrabartyella piscis TaxID=2918914 RepID=UPI0029585101|nr:sugar kinase [Chakrabartyella piscis]
MRKVVTFGEIMLRLNPDGYGKFVQADHFATSYAGGEANVALSLANYGMDAHYVTVLPKHEIGQMTVNGLRKFGVNTSDIIRDGDRIGVLYLEKGASQRPSKVIYDRKYSAIAMYDPAKYDWKSIFEGAEWFHFTGITPALSKEAAQATLDAAKTAHEMGITVSCDLNYRSNLWSREAAGETMAKLMPYVDVCISNEEDASDVFGIKSEGTDVTTGKLSHEGYKEVAQKLVDRFGFKKVAITLRGSISASVNEWAGMLYSDGECYFSKNYTIQIVDRVGGGDSFGGGLVYALMSDKTPQQQIEFAVAASCLKQTIEGDFNLVTIPEVEKLAGGDASGRVQR